MSETTNGKLPISPDLLAILRDPLAVQEPEKYGDDPGKLELVRDYWLVSKDTGLKYPIRDGIPVMLIDEGMRWKDTAVDELPVPPPDDEPAPLSYQTSATSSIDADTRLAIYAGVFVSILGLLILMWQSRAKDKKR